MNHDLNRFRTFSVNFVLRLRFLKLISQYHFENIYSCKRFIISYLNINYIPNFDGEKITFVKIPRFVISKINMGIRDK